jgi:hypothetical protein
MSTNEHPRFVFSNFTIGVADKAGFSGAIDVPDTGRTT